MIEPARYVIRVRGGLEATWSDRLGGMTIAAIPSAAGRVTELAGELPDPAALHGVLAALYDLGLPILSVTRLTADVPADGAWPSAAR